MPNTFIIQINCNTSRVPSKVSGSDFSKGTYCRDWGFSLFSSVLPCKHAGTTSDYAMPASIHTLRNSLVTLIASFGAV